MNEADNDGETPLTGLIAIASVGRADNDAADRLDVLLACDDLDLDATWKGQTAEEWAEEEGDDALAAAIAAQVRCDGVFKFLLPAVRFVGCAVLAMHQPASCQCWYNMVLIYVV